MIGFSGLCGFSEVGGTEFHQKGCPGFGALTEGQETAAVNSFWGEKRVSIHRAQETDPFLASSSPFSRRRRRQEAGRNLPGGTLKEAGALLHQTVPRGITTLSASFPKTSPAQCVLLAVLTHPCQQAGAWGAPGELSMHPSPEAPGRLSLHVRLTRGHVLRITHPLPPRPPTCLVLTPASRQAPPSTTNAKEKARRPWEAKSFFAS